MLDYLRIMLDARLGRMDERGASAVEYGLLIAGIAAMIVARRLRVRRRGLNEPLPEHLQHGRLERRNRWQLLTPQFVSTG